MKKKKDNIYNVIISISVFILMLYSFNVSIAEQIFHTSHILLAFVLSAIILLVIATFNYKSNKFNLRVFFVISLLLMITLVNNYYFIENRYFVAIVYSILMFLPLFICKSESIVKIIDKILPLFCIEHIFGTIFAALFGNIYLNHIIPFIANGRYILAQSQFLSGYNPGFTSHYSTNGIYLSISSIYFFSKFIKNRNKKNILLFILSLICLFLTAKRGHILFTLLSLSAYYIFINKEQFTKKFLKFIGGAFAILLIVLCISVKSPEILNVIERFESATDRTTLLNGREEMYSLAIEKWKESPFIGHGWMSFTYFYHLYLRNPNDKYGIDFSPAHNVYLELLCDVGIFGTIIFMTIILFILYQTIKVLDKNKSSSILAFSACYQLFFLLYSFSGNPLYDVQCYLIYFMSCGISLYYYRNTLSRKVLKRNE